MFPIRLQRRPHLERRKEVAALRVIHIVLSMDVGGMERGLVNHVREAQRLGEEVSVICLERPGVLASQLEALGAPVLCVFKKPGVRPGTIWHLERLLRQLRPDVVHTHQVGPLFYGAPAAWQAAVPVRVHTEHGNHYGVRWQNRVLGRLAGRFTHRFFCLSEDIAQEAAACRIVPRSKIRVITNGIDLSRFEPSVCKESLRQQLGLPVAGPLIGTISRLAPVKCQDVLLRGFAQLRQSIPTARLVLVGDGPKHAALLELAHELGISASVHFVGYQATPEDYLRCFDVFALTSSSEGMPQSLMEAAAARIPIVASRVGGIPELIEHDTCGRLFSAGNCDELASTLFTALNERERSSTMADVARQRVQQRFDVRLMAEEYHRRFCELLNENTMSQQQALIGHAR